MVIHSVSGTPSSARGRTEAKGTEVPSAPRKCVLPETYNLEERHWYRFSQSGGGVQVTCTNQHDRHAYSSFLGLASYYRRFIQDFAEVASPLHKLAEKGNTFVWTEACDRAFCELKRCLVTAPALVYPKFDLESICH